MPSIGMPTSGVGRGPRGIISKSLALGEDRQRRRGGSSREKTVEYFRGGGNEL